LPELSDRCQVLSMISRVLFSPLGCSLRSSSAGSVCDQIAILGWNLARYFDSADVYRYLGLRDAASWVPYHGQGQFSEIIGTNYNVTLSNVQWLHRPYLHLLPCRRIRYS
jgi:hypothetical protein